MLPIVERELRIGARSSGTYRSRRNIAALLFLVFAGLYWNLTALGAWGNRTIFTVLSGLGFAYALLAGLILAADAISSEKRDGTLGLLFLTALKPYDLIAGTISATSLKAFYGLLAMFPILGLSLLLGGIEYGEFAHVCATLVTTLLFSLACCLFVSSLSRNRLRAISRSALLLFLFVGAIPIFTETMKHATRFAPPRWVEVLALFSPITTLELSSRPWFVVQNDYWLSLLLINSMSIAMLAFACFLLPWIWKDRAPNRKKERVSRRQKLGSENPFFWLTKRHSSESTRFLVALLVFAVIATMIGRYNVFPGRFGELYSQMNAWGFLLVSAHIALIFRIAALSTSRLAEDRELGALESILVTPLRVREILRGHSHALLTQLGGPALAVLFVHAILCWGFLIQYALDNEIAGGEIGVLRFALNELRHGSFEPWGLFGVSTLIVGGALIMVLSWLALASSGMWIALRSRHASRALWFTLTAVFFPPTAAFFAIVTFGIWLDLPQGNNSFWGWFCLFFAIAFSVTNSLTLMIYSWINLRKHFRTAATERFSRPTHRHLTDAFRWPLRMAAAAIAILILFSLLYAEEKSRGLRAWNAVQAKYASNWENLRSISTTPAPVPDAENFGALKIFKALFDYRYEPSGQVTWLHEAEHDQALSLTITGTRQGSPVYTTNFNPAANWALQKHVDLAAWQRYYQSNSIFARVCLTNASPAQAVLQALSIFDSELAELDVASRLPKVRFPIHYEETHAAYWPHLAVLKNAGTLLQLRSCARLAAGDISGARSDIEFCFRLANAVKNESGLFPFRVRRLLFNDALNPLWEGLSRNQWDDDSLIVLQKEFAVDFFAEYPKAIREQTLSFADFYDRIAMPDETLLRRLGKEPISPRAARFYPVGWKYLNQAGLMRLVEETLIPLIDPAAHHVFVTAAANLAPAIRRSHVAIDPVSQRVIPWELEMFQNSILDTAHAQVSIDQAVIACALERYRLAHGSFPADSKSLALKIPSDPITGAPYKYKLTPDGKFILYSLGWNQTDDGGEAVTTAPPNREQDTRKGDWVWKY